MEGKLLVIINDGKVHMKNQTRHAEFIHWINQLKIELMQIYVLILTEVCYKDPQQTVISLMCIINHGLKLYQWILYLPYSKITALVEILGII